MVDVVDVGAVRSCGSQARGGAVTLNLSVQRVLRMRRIRPLILGLRVSSTGPRASSNLALRREKLMALPESVVCVAEGVGSTRLHQTRRAPSAHGLPRARRRDVSTLKLAPLGDFEDSALSYTSMGARRSRTWAALTVSPSARAARAVVLDLRRHEDVPTSAGSEGGRARTASRQLHRRRAPWSGAARPAAAGRCSPAASLFT